MPFIETKEFINPIEYLTYCSNYTESYFNDTLVTRATSFFYYKNEKLYLVSNWHVLSGRNPKADKNGIFQPEHEKGAIPNKIKVQITGWTEGTNTNFGGQGYIIEIPLYKNEQPLYKEKVFQENQEYIDIACLPIDTKSFVFEGKQLNGLPICANTIFPEHLVSNYIIHPSDDVFVIGYPFGKINPLPIWKKASIASSSIDESYKIFIDTATKSGMSGSPVFYVATEYNISVDGKKLPEERGYKAEFIGIYSGRVIENNEDKNEDAYVRIKDYDLSTAAQLGILWKKSAIDEVIG